MDRSALRFGDYEIDLGRRELRLAGRPVDLPRTPLHLLLYLVEHRDRTVPRDELLEAIWPDAVVLEETLTRTLTEVRRAVGDQGDERRVIRTLKGIGYRFVAEVEVVPEDEAPGPRESARPRARSRLAAQASGFLGALVVAALAAWGLLRPREAAVGATPPFGIAVLPIASFSAEAADSQFADGLTEEITHALSQNGYPVVARTTAAQWRERAADVRGLGGLLGVSHVLEGSVRRSADRLRVTIQLVATDSGLHVWSERFDHAGGDALAIQSQITDRVAAHVYRVVWQDSVAMKRDPKLAELSSLIVEGRRAFLEARWQDTISNAERALALAPPREPFVAWRAYMNGLASLAWANAYAFGPIPFAEAGPKLLQHAEAGVALSPQDPFARMALSRAFAHSWRWSDAEREMRRTCELEPRGFSCGGIVAQVCAALGCIDEQIEGARWRLRESPAEPGAWFTLAIALVNDGRDEEARAAALRVRELGGERAIFLLPSIPWRRGEHAEAIAQLTQALVALGASAAAREIEQRAAESPETAWRWQAEQLASPDASAFNLNAFLAARMFAELGDAEHAIAALERSVARHETGLEMFGLDPVFDRMRETPRFRVLIETMGLTAYHAKYREQLQRRSSAAPTP
jgi:TolB-like protein/DNA-binding winged helix-turn-helix (wHTH) protein